MVNLFVNKTMLSSIFARNLSRKSLLAIKQCRCISSTKTRYKEDEEDNENQKPAISKAILSKYEAFTDDRAPIILDVEEERRKLRTAQPEEEEESEDNFDIFEGISPDRGVDGVIELDELVAILRRENALDIFVVEIPPAYRYVRYIVICTGKSYRHMLGMTEFIRKVFKYKCYEKETIPMIEGKNSKQWMAIDLGNIALHVFAKGVREVYDLETLWSVGRDFDDLSNQSQDPITEMFNKYSVDLSQLVPADDDLPASTTQESRKGT